LLDVRHGPIATEFCVAERFRYGHKNGHALAPDLCCRLGQVILILHRFLSSFRKAAVWRIPEGKDMAAEKTLSVVDQVVDFLGDVGARWGLPVEACRVHGYFYLIARPATAAEVRRALRLSEKTLDEALTWLADYRLIERTKSDAWRTDSDPWELMMRALEERQRREVGPALDLLRACDLAAPLDDARQRTIATQIGKLLRLVEDLSAISRQAQRLSPSTVRHMVGLGGLAARVLDRTFGRRER
jgi:DNA-binding transcriptional regulator GbsR (MarR family)